MDGTLRRPSRSTSSSDVEDAIKGIELESKTYGSPTRTFSGNMQSGNVRLRGKFCSLNSVFAFLTGVALTLMLLRSPHFQFGSRGDIWKSDMTGSSIDKLNPLTNNAIDREQMDVRIYKNSQDFHRKLTRPDQKSITKADIDASTLALAQTDLREKSSSADTDTESGNQATLSEVQSASKTNPASNAAAASQEAGNIASTEGLIDVLKANDKEEPADFLVESNAGNPGEETFQETSEHGDEGQQPHDGIVDSQNTNGSSSDDLLESFMSGASLEVQERNGMIMTEELEHASQVEQPLEQYADFLQEEEVSSGSQDAETAMTEPETKENASELATSVTTEDMSAEAATANDGKSEGWSTELEQSNIGKAALEKGQE